MNRGAKKFECIERTHTMTQNIVFKVLSLKELLFRRLKQQHKLIVRLQILKAGITRLLKDG